MALDTTPSGRTILPAGGRPGHDTRVVVRGSVGVMPWRAARKASPPSRAMSGFDS